MPKILLGIVLVIVIAMIVLRFLKRSDAIGSTVKQIMAARGAARCFMATQLLETLANKKSNSLTVSLWNAIEMPLLDALPDCPPDHKLSLANALTDAAKHVTNRDVAKRMMTMRNSLL